MNFTKMKKYCITLFFVILVISCILQSRVNAESLKYEDGYAYRQVKDEGYDDLTNNHVYSYRVYTTNGLVEGKVNVSSELYKNNVWFLCVTPGRKYLLLFKYVKCNTSDNVF